MKRILIADYHEIFRTGIKQLLSEMGRTYKVDEANNGQEVIEKIWRNDYDAILLDISMPDRNGLDILKDIKNYKPDLKVLILSMYPEEQFAIRALRAKADGYLTKAVKHDELLTALQKILQGEKYISSLLVNKLAFFMEGDNKKALHETLSDREYEVMCLTATGKSVKQIAMKLALSDKTVSTYRYRILNKMQMNNIAQLIRYAIRNDLINQSEI